MCIRDRYQRRVHGDFNFQILNNLQLIMCALLLINYGTVSILNLAFGMEILSQNGIALMLAIFYFCNIINEIIFLVFENYYYGLLIFFIANFFIVSVLSVLAGIFCIRDTRNVAEKDILKLFHSCLLYTSPSPRDLSTSRMPSSA
eukprot:TRINITY_DN9442_c0_g1_i1.p2 TRINITY_DN9442_c0_g1~~TRINITY_DN9442_c0_g1_i1.p2  ORF type:complete len:162 (+),score=24.07 TRINITY_DN9442_c0_g1_i1:52-486(+)